MAVSVSLYPGCSFDGIAREYRESVEAVSKILGVAFRELEDWSCCGASSAHVTSDELAIALAARNLAIADRVGLDLVVPCAACYQRLKVAEKHLLRGETIEGLSSRYRGSLHIKPIVDFFWEELGDDGLAKKVKRPLAGLNAVCYYGCLTARPPEITDAKNPEDPREMDYLMASLGANVKNWSYKTDCCGGNLALTRPDLAMKLTQKLLDMAEEAGADCIVVACPMCHSNLDSKQNEISQASGQRYHVPILYFAELMGIAFGDPSAEKWLGRHMTNPKPLLKGIGLI